MFKINYSNKFESDLKKCHKRGYDLNDFKNVFVHLEQTGTVPRKYRPHLLSGDYSGVWECHIRPDWLLLWTTPDENTINLFRTGTHSDLF